ncbi:uncharacterized protein LOC120659542 [Panicum virgatum]|uniref:uncharacterized protein LOC120659542 n=1 Tax=Panicum virgatum TaxID=38727 RepID=UPI0019D52488|nr:uncharacterized protein LOC120659542 [Panicum virgatum]
MFRADTIDEAAEEILINCLLMEDTSTTRSLSSRDNVFYFDGWDGLGASAVLRAIARRLTASSPDDQVIHIEYCSMWESRRSLQRAVAEPLRLPDQVMELFDRQDEEDDYQGVPQGSRAGLEQVTTEIYQHVQQQMKHRFFVIIHNGSNEEVDLASLCGFALSGYSTNKVLWTFQGRFRLKPRAEIDTAMKSTGTTDTFFSALPGHGGVPQAQLWEQRHGQSKDGGGRAPVLPEAVGARHAQHKV